MINLNISGETRVCGIIGDPVGHSISPAMQNAAFQTLGLDYVYVPFRVRKADLEKAVQSIRALNIRGLNVTIPHKVSIIPFLDRLDPLAEKIGAVNTIVNDQGVLSGYNTDAAGFLNALLSEKVNPAGRKVLILGSGGAARSIACVLAEKGSDLVILNRHKDSAVDLAQRISRFTGSRVEALELNFENLEFGLRKAEILVNTTSLGMLPEIDKTPVHPDLIRPGMIVFDIIYNPVKTRLLKESEKKGAKIINGIEMLVEQGAAAFELWTGKSAPLEIMRQIAQKEMMVN